MNFKYHPIHLKTLVLTLLIFILSTGYAINSYAGSNYGFIKTIAQKYTGKGLKRIPGAIAEKSANTLSKKFNISEKLLESPIVRQYATLGIKISSTSPFAKKMLKQSSMPDVVIRQYAQYGQKNYLHIAESTLTTMKHADKTKVNTILSRLGQKYKGMNKVINKFNQGGYDSDVFVRTIKLTGRTGLSVFKWAANRPATAVATAAIAWYSYDPEGFTEALQKSGKTLGGFIGTSIVTTAGAVGKGVTDGISNKLKDFSITTLISGSFLIFLIMILFTKIGRRIVFFPIRFVGLKLSKKMDEAENNLSNTKAQIPQQSNTTKTDSEPAKSFL